jgi:hypothetical protein
MGFLKLCYRLGSPEADSEIHFEIKDIFGGINICERRKAEEQSCGLKLGFDADLLKISRPAGEVWSKNCPIRVSVSGQT